MQAKQVVMLFFQLYPFLNIFLFQITAIVFVYSKTTYLPLNMFPHFPNLQKIIVSNPYTLMSALKNGHFLLADALTEVFITNQRLQDLGARVFEGAKKIATIKLDNDMIENVDEAAFSDLFTLEVLSLSHNLIKALPMKTFSTVKNLKNLDLSANMISWLPGVGYSMPIDTC